MTSAAELLRSVTGSCRPRRQRRQIRSPERRPGNDFMHVRSPARLLAARRAAPDRVRSSARVGRLESCSRSATAGSADRQVFVAATGADAVWPSARHRRQRSARSRPASWCAEVTLPDGTDEAELILWVRGCNDTAVPWTVTRVRQGVRTRRTRSRSKTARAPSTTGTTISRSRARAGTTDVADGLGEVWRRALDANVRYYEAWGRVANDYVRELEHGPEGLLARGAPPHDHPADAHADRPGAVTGAARAHATERRQPASPPRPSCSRRRPARSPRERCWSRTTSPIRSRPRSRRIVDSDIDVTIAVEPDHVDLAPG